MRKIVFMIDVDNTVLDNDGVKSDMERHLLSTLGPDLAKRFWELYEVVRNEMDVVDFIETIRRLDDEYPESHGVISATATTLMEWDFGIRLHTNALETLEHFKRIGTPVIVSDGDPIFQPLKIQQCGITEVVDGRVLIFVHKEQRLPAVERYFNAEHFVLIDDKPGILMRSKAALGDRLTTVHVLQGKYALDPKYAVDYKPDIVVRNFSDLLSCDADAFLLKKPAATA